MKPFALVFESLDPSGARWTLAIKIKKQFGTYAYPRSFRNRHDHGNEKPSFWALGYMTLDAMKEAVSDSDWEQYKSVHTNCCGFKK